VVRQNYLQFILLSMKSDIWN